MLAFLSLIPGIGSLISTVLGLVFNAKVKIAQAKLGADRDVAVALVKAGATEAHERNVTLSTIAGSRVLLALAVLFALPLVAYEWQCVLIDTVIHRGATLTPPLRGEIAQWANTIIYCIFGAPTTLALGHMWFSRKTS